jgi:flagellar M-ring protein FliF
MMQNINQLGRQLREIWKQLGTNQRVSVVTAALVLLAGLVLLGLWSSQADYGLLYGKLPEAEAAKVVAALDEMKIPKRIGRGTGSIFVPQDKIYTVRMQLAAKGLPQGEGVGYEIFDKPNFGLSDFMQRANYLRALMGELARTIEQLDDVESARVHITAPEHRLLVDTQTRPTAAVLLRVKGQGQLSSQSVNAIRFLVANSVEGLQANNVSISDNRGNVLFENTDLDSMVGLTSNQLQVRRNVELYFAKKAEEMLTRVLGPDQAVVRVAAELNFDTINRTEKKYDPDGQVPRSETVNDETTDSTSANSGGAVGVVVNSATETNSTATSPQTISKMHKKQTTKEYDINESTSTLLQAAGGIKRLSAAVFVATRMEGTGADRKPVPRSPEDLAKLRTIVQNAVGIITSSDGSRKDDIALEEMPFNDQFAQDYTRQVESQKKQDFWWNLGKNLVYPALALGILLMFWRTLRRTPAENIPIGIPLGQIGRKANGNGNGHGHAPVPWMNEPEPAMVTVDVLNQLVRENPSNMTQAIRNWMTKGKPSSS